MISNLNNDDDACRVLAARIVKEVCVEYRLVVRKMLRNPVGKKRKSLILEKKRLEDFFYSQWFEALSDCNPDELIRKITEITIIDEKKDAEARIRKLKREKEERIRGLL